MPGMGEIELLDLADADMLGSFSGGLGFSLILDGKHNTVNKPIYSAADWQNGFLSNFLQQPSTSTVPNSTQPGTSCLFLSSRAFLLVSLPVA
jgi:hypothetical protein